VVKEKVVIVKEMAGDLKAAMVVVIVVVTQQVEIVVVILKAVVVMVVNQSYRRHQGYYCQVWHYPVRSHQGKTLFVSIPFFFFSQMHV
jgi:hypothetical protein